MASGDSVHTTGQREFLAMLRTLSARATSELAGALYAEVQIERLESMRRTPVDTGALRASHVVTEPAFSGDTISVTLGVGGVAAPYAVHVHENLDAIHPVGQAKFLESTVLESVPYLAQRIARRVRLSTLVGR